MDYAKTLIMDKNVALKYQREAISTTFYILSYVEVKKGTHSTPFELWYGYSPNVKYFKVFEENVTFLKTLGMVSLMKKVKKVYS